MEIGNKVKVASAQHWSTKYFINVIGEVVEILDCKEYANVGVLVKKEDNEDVLLLMEDKTFYFDKDELEIIGE